MSFESREASVGDEDTPGDNRDNLASTALLEPASHTGHAAIGV
jgi:hypothetical protein